MQPYLRRPEMRALRTLAVCLVAATCARDAPVAPKPASDPATEQLTALATALTDAQQWLLPSLGERDTAIEAIAGRCTDLATSLARADTNALSSRIAAAREELEAANAGDPGEQFIQLAALGLVLNDVEAVTQGRLWLVPIDATAATSQGSLSEPKHPKSDRSRP